MNGVELKSSLLWGSRLFNLGALRAGFYNQSDLFSFAFGPSKFMVFTDLPHV